MLHGDEVAVAQVSGGAVVARARSRRNEFSSTKLLRRSRSRVSGSSPISAVSSRLTSAIIDARLSVVHRRNGGSGHAVRWFRQPGPAGRDGAEIRLRRAERRGAPRWSRSAGRRDSSPSPKKMMAKTIAKKAGTRDDVWTYVLQVRQLNHPARCRSLQLCRAPIRGWPFSLGLSERRRLAGMQATVRPTRYDVKRKSYTVNDLTHELRGNGAGKPRPAEKVMLRG